MKKKLTKVVLYQTVKTFLIFAGFLAAMSWLSDGQIYIEVVWKFALWMTLSGIAPIVLSLLMLSPELDKQTPEDRLAAFWKYHMPFKLISVLTVSLAISLIVLYLMIPMPLFGLTVGQAVAAALGIGFVFAVLAALMMWYIIQLEEPPFRNLNR